MALQVWLPLDGDLKNNGLLDVIVTNHGATVENNGKIGKCYAFDNNTSYIALQHINLYSILNGAAQPFSICFWVYQADASRAIIFGDFSVSGGNNFNIELTTGHTLRWYWGTPDFSISAMNVGQGVWAHVAFTYDGTTLKGYLNGQLKYTGTYTLAAKGRTTGEYYLGRDGRTGTTTLNGRLNDFRIYNHALSAKEVKEISKGLILHYPLDNININNTTLLTSEISNTAYNGATGKYGYNDDSNLAKTTGTFQGKSCVKISTRTAGVSATPYVYFSNLYTSNGTNQPAYKVLTFEYYTTCPTTTWLNIYKLGNGTGIAMWRTINSTGIHSGTYTNFSNAIQVKPNEWNYVEVILHGTTDANAEWGYCINGPSHTSSADYYFLYANIHLYANNTALIYDSSGYGNTGTIRKLVNLTPDTPRYLNALKFQQASILADTGFPIGVDPDFTISFWTKIFSSETYASYVDLCGVYDNATSEGNPFRLELCGSTPGDNLMWFRGPSGQSAGGFNMNSSSSSGWFTKDKWHHVVLVGNGKTKQYYCYLDGVQCGTYNGSSNSWTPSGKVYVGDYSSAIVADFSDFRLYSTALSADDVKELYNTSAMIDSKQNLYGYEFVESMENRELLNSILITSSYGEHITPINNSKYINGELTFTTNGSSAGSPYIPITPSGHIYKYDIEFSVNAGNQFYIGFERYDQNKTPRSNNACAYVYATKSTTNLSHKRIKGTVNLSTDGTNPCAFIALRILNGWSGTDNGVTGTATIHRLSLQEVSSTVTATINKQGICIADNIYEDTETILYDNGYIESNQFIEY